MKKFLNSKYGESIVLIALSFLNQIMTVIFYSVRFSDFLYEDYDRESLSFWTATDLYLDPYVVRSFNVIAIIAFVIGALIFIAAALISLFKRNKIAFYVSAIYNLALSLVFLFVHVAFNVLRAGAVACIIISIILSILTLVFLILRRGKVKDSDVEENRIDEKNFKTYKAVLFICECIATVILFTIFLIPLYSETSNGETVSYALIKSLGVGVSPIYVSVIFLVAFVAFFVALLYFISTISYLKSDKVFVKKSKNYIFGATAFTLVFFIAGFCIAFFLRIVKGGSYDDYTVTTVSYIPFVCSLVVLIAFSVVQGRIATAVEIVEEEAKKTKFKFEPLIYLFLLTGVIFLSLAINIIEIRLGIKDYFTREVKLTGYQLLTSYKDLEGGFQSFAFVLFAFLLTSSVMFVLSFAGFLSKNRDYYKLVKVGAFVDFIFAMMIGLFGIYFKMAQKVNEENLKSILAFKDVLLNSNEIINDVSSQGVYLMAGSFLVLVIMMIRGQFNLTVPLSSGNVGESLAPTANLPVAASDAVSNDVAAPALLDFDACPAFTELDQKESVFAAELEEKRKNLFDNLTLPNLVRFVVDYARESRLHLSYSLEDMATFVAGLGASRLTILQGMSGTGKTSLPKIFTEAVMGVCEIVEVESSWRDKNELLGYYNEFSKCFTPKKFTQYLYKARLNSSVLTFIVLDEMNLSRIEYYFSDFLSLMENEEDKREIKLLNVKLCRTVNGEKTEYTGLTDGHTVKIPPNVWFIGTANRDESTFEISDKVYDRAQTMNFNKRAPKVHSFSEPMPQRFASYDMLLRLFDEAKRNFVFEAEDNAIVQKVEKLLMPYNISFGNRILKQMEDFVKIYCTCFGDKDAVVNEAVEKILLSKVVSKLENKIVENKEALATEFNKLGLYRCGAFVQKLNED